MSLQKFTSVRPSDELPQLMAALRKAESEAGTEPRSWFSIENRSQSETEVLIYNDIGGGGISASDFAREFSKIKSSAITVRINSGGGSVFDGVSIFNSIQRHPATVNVFIDGIAASAASFIAMAGDVIMMSPHSQMMIHEASGLTLGSADDMREMADFLDRASTNIASIYSERAGGTTEEWRARMKQETWFSDREAVDAGLADGIVGVDEAERKIAAALEAVVLNQAEEEPPAEETPEPEPIDYRRLFDQIVEEADELIFAAQ